MCKVITLTICLLAGMVGRAQSQTPIATDRPGISTSPAVTPAGVLQLENGVEFAHSSSLRLYQLPTVLLRTGLLDRVELRASMRVTRQDSLSGDLYKTFWSTSALSLGTKVYVCTEQGWRPEIALVANLVIPYTTQPALRSAYLGHDFLLIFSRGLTPKLSFCGNLGGAWDGRQTGATFLYTASLGGKITEKTGYFAEQYGFCPEKGKMSPGIDAGFSHLASPNIQFDLSAGTNLATGFRDYFLAAGVSFRIDARKRSATPSRSSARGSEGMAINTARKFYQQNAGLLPYKKGILL